MLYTNLWQGIIDSTGTKAWQLFSCMPSKVKIFKKLLTPTWNGIAASVRYVSSTPVVINARFNY